MVRDKEKNVETKQDQENSDDDQKFPLLQWFSDTSLKMFRMTQYTRLTNHQPRPYESSRTKYSYITWAIFGSDFDVYVMWEILSIVDWHSHHIVLQKECTFVASCLCLSNVIRRPLIFTLAPFFRFLERYRAPKSSDNNRSLSYHRQLECFYCQYDYQVRFIHTSSSHD